MNSVRLPRPEAGEPRIVGVVTPGFETVMEPFRAGVADPARTGAALSVWHHGHEVVNIWCGTADERTGRPWGQDTTSVLFSCSKGLVAVLIARLAQAGLLDVEAPLADLWPDFSAHGKDRVSIADVLAHRGGVSAPLEDLALDDVLDGDSWAARIAAQQPLWTPGSGHSYHALTFGPIVERIVASATDRQLHELFVDEVAAPLGADVSFRPDASDLRRVSRLVTDDTWESAVSGASPADDEWIARGSTLGTVFPRGLVRGDTGFNDARVQRAGLAAAGAIGTASGLARIWSATVAKTLGVRLLDDESAAAMRRPRSEGPWVFDPGPPYQRWGAGVQLSSAVTPWWSADSFGHDGAGGQSGFADPQARLAIGYLTNAMDRRDRVAPILEALRKVIPGPDAV
ncbi:serine hydrolase domain-containing protein [Nakamurella deserti]|uniref:serine hydrolase domain-containing protein n=1 Tax=Nakamurella deserti TaxID=2164074 RepID=UPI00130073F0|nr:serine hydrolase domain-containing protein [Nakamurella deserti]